MYWDNPNMIQFRLIKLTKTGINAKTYGMLKKWWNAHGWEGMAPIVLHTLGVVAYDDKFPVCAGFLYMTNSGCGLAQIEWVVSNPDAKPMQAARSISALIEHLTKQANDLDYGVVMTAVNQPSLVRLFERANFKKTDSGMTHLINIRKNPNEKAI